MSEVTKLTLAQARDSLRAGDVTSVELTQACLDAIDGADALGAFVHKTPDIALDRARAADARIAQGDAPAMCGLPIGIKDLFCTKGVDSQAASRILQGFRPEYESTVGQQLQDAGAVMLGKLNMDEFAMGSSNETSVYGNAVNPWKVDDRALTPGGSSADPARYQTMCVTTGAR
jgi:aspartyl-tRNA(Asn)/glutamyl-tRNA(Gln) amidotransferase subunit A